MVLVQTQVAPLLVLRQGSHLRAWMNSFRSLDSLPRVVQRLTTSSHGW